MLCYVVFYLYIAPREQNKYDEGKLLDWHENKKDFAKYLDVHDGSLNQRHNNERWGI